MLNKPGKIHFVAIGGSVMHNLAILLKNKGFAVSGSDDHIYEPARSSLSSHGILPEKEGWFPERITGDLQAIILGMHAQADNPELKAAQELNVPIYSFPEFIYQQSQNKQRVVVGGSHGKTTITAIILHVLQYIGKDFDYLVGAKIRGFETMVKLSEAPIIVLEGDEYPSSAIDKTPKFHHYHHHIALLSGVAWDHINVYKTLDDYVKQFEIYADNTPKAGTFIFSADDDIATMIASKDRPDANRTEYTTHPYIIKDNRTFLIRKGHPDIPIQLFGKHNMQNVSAAFEVLKRLSVTEDQFYEAIATFQGASQRLEKIKTHNDILAYHDYAHAPSKVEASTAAMKEKYPDRKLIACLELHTFSSLNKSFLAQYAGTMKEADVPLVFFDPKNLVHKKMPELSIEEVMEAFDIENLRVFDECHEMENEIRKHPQNDSVFLFMSSGNFGGLNLQDFTNSLV